MNLFADESVDKPIVERLRQDTHDVAYVAELAPSITDDEVLPEANRRSAVLVTADKDFGELVFRQGVIHSGVVLLRLAGLANQTKGEIVAEVCRLRETDGPDSARSPSSYLARFVFPAGCEVDPRVELPVAVGRGSLRSLRRLNRAFGAPGSFVHMSGCNHSGRLPQTASTVRVGALVLFVLLSAPGNFLSGPVRDAHAQQQPPGKVYRIGEGRNLVWEFRSTDGSLDRLPQFAEELVRLKVDIIVARASSGATAAKRATTTIPVVFAGVYAPVEVGLVSNLARPSGNLTGVAVNASDIAAKRVQLLKELVPTLKRVAMLSHPAHPSNPVQVQGAEAAASALGVHLDVVPVRSAEDFDGALRALSHIDGLLHSDTPLFATHRARLAEAAARSRLPAIFPSKAHVDAGGLMSYGADLPDLYRQVAIHVDKILKGAKPADLPVEQPTKFELVINLKTAKVLGLPIPPSVLARADQVLE